MRILEKKQRLYSIYEEMDKFSKKEKLSAPELKVYRDLQSDFDELFTHVNFEQIKRRYEMSNEIEGVLNNGGKGLDNFNPIPNSQFSKRAAQKALAQGFKMLVTGERSKLDSNLLNELGESNGLREFRTEYSSDNIVSTKYTNVFLEIVKDDSFLSLIPNEVVEGGYLRIPKVTRANAPTASGKESSGSMDLTDTNFTSILLEPKNLYCNSIYHKDLVRDAGNRAVEAIWQSTRDAISKKLVSNIFYGSSANNGEFNGLDNITGKQVYDTSGGSIVDYSLINRGVRLLTSKFVPQSEIVTMLHPTTYAMYSDLRELASSGMYLQPPAQISEMPYLVNAQIKTDYSTNKTRLYMMNPKSAFLAMFGQFEMTLNERYADLDHAAALMVFRSDFAFRDPENLFVATNLPTT